MKMVNRKLEKKLRKAEISYKDQEIYGNELI